MTADADAGRLVIRRRIAAAREELFEQWTDPESMRVWMCPDDIVSTDVLMDLRVGGSLLITMRGATRAYEHRGEFTIIDRPAKLAFTWISGATDSRATLVTVEFFEVSETESDLVLTHDELPTTQAKDQHRAGWNQIIGRLDQFLQSKR